MADFIEPLPESEATLRAVHDSISGLYLNSQAVASDLWREGEVPWDEESLGRLAAIVRDLQECEQRALQGDRMLYWFARAQDQLQQPIAGQSPSVHDAALWQGIGARSVLSEVAKGDRSAAECYFTMEEEPLGDPAAMSCALDREMARAANLFASQTTAEVDTTGAHGPVRAHHFGLFPDPEWDDPELRKAIVALATQRRDDNTDAEILRQFTTEPSKLQARIRSARTRGKTTLPKRD